MLTALESTDTAIEKPEQKEEEVQRKPHSITNRLHQTKITELEDLIPSDWKEHLSPEFTKSYFIKVPINQSPT